MASTSMENPITSESRMNSCRLSSHFWPVAVRNWMASNHSASVSSTSRAKPCRWRISAAKTCARRGVRAFVASLTSAIAACYSLTFGIIAANRKLPVKRLTAHATGVVKQEGGNFTYTSITINPDIVIDASASEDQVKLTEEMAHKADLYCIITNAVRGKVEIAVEPNLIRE